MRWKKIEGYDNYSVSDTGLVMNTRTGRVLKPHISKDGYYTVGLFKHCKGKTYKIHRLIALAFIPNPDNLYAVDHINGVKTDNRAENLQWLTSPGNTKKFWDGISEERREKIKNFLVGNGNRYRKSVSKPIVCLDTGTLYESAGQAARELNMCRTSVLRVADGTYKQTKGYHFKFLGE